MVAPCDTLKKHSTRHVKFMRIVKFNNKVMQNDEDLRDSIISCPKGKK